MEKSNYFKLALAGLMAGGLAISTTGCKKKSTEPGDEKAAKSAAYKTACEENADRGYTLSTSDCTGTNGCEGSFDGMTGEITTCATHATCDGTLTCTCNPAEECANDAENPAVAAANEV